MNRSNNVLLTCVGRRHYLVTYFREVLSESGKVIGVDMDETAPALAACDFAHLVPELGSPDYLDRILEIVNSYKVAAVFSLNDLEIGIIAKNLEYLEANSNAKFFVPDIETWRVCADKWETFKFSKVLGLPTIPTFLSVKKALSHSSYGKIKFPLIVKPRWGSASISLKIVESQSELKTAYDECHENIAKSPLSSFGHSDAVIIQQFIQGTEYGVDVLFNHSCMFQGFTPKRKIAMRAGETEKAISVDPNRLKILFIKLPQNFAIEVTWIVILWKWMAKCIC